MIFTLRFLGVFLVNGKKWLLNIYLENFWKIKKMPRFFGAGYRALLILAANAKLKTYAKSKK